MLDTTYWQASRSLAQISLWSAVSLPGHASWTPSLVTATGMNTLQGKKGRRTEESMWRLEHLSSDEESAVSSILCRALFGCANYSQFGVSLSRSKLGLTRSRMSD